MFVQSNSFKLLLIHVIVTGQTKQRTKQTVVEIYRQYIGRSARRYSTVAVAVYTLLFLLRDLLYLPPRVFPPRPLPFRIGYYIGNTDRIGTGLSTDSLRINFSLYRKYYSLYTLLSCLLSARRAKTQQGSRYIPLYTVQSAESPKSRVVIYNSPTYNPKRLGKL